MQIQHRNLSVTSLEVPAADCNSHDVVVSGYLERDSNLSNPGGALALHHRVLAWWLVLECIAEG